MSRHSVGRIGGLLIGIACLLGLAVACSTDTPTAPVQEPAPIVGLIAQFTCSSSGLTVSFIDRSLGNPTSFSWDFGDGGTSTQQNPVHVYTVDINFAVQLTVSKAGLPPASVEHFLDNVGGTNCVPTAAAP